LDGPLPKLCPAVALTHQDGHHSAVALLLKAALIQVSDTINDIKKDYMFIAVGSTIHAIEATNVSS
jgi:hypothetical protein